MDLAAAIAVNHNRAMAPRDVFILQDDRVIRQPPDAVDAELERVRPLVAEGGYMAGLDHGVPPDISFANYCYYAERLRGIL